MTRRVETRVAVQCDRGCVMTARRAVSVAAVVAGVALVTAPMVLPAAGVTPPPMPAVAPTGDWVPGWTPGAESPEWDDRPSARPTTARTTLGELPQTGAGVGIATVVLTVGALATGAVLVARMKRGDRE